MATTMLKRNDWQQTPRLAAAGFVVWLGGLSAVLLLG